MMRGLVRRLAAVLGVSALCAMTGCAGFWVYPGTASSSTGTGSTTGDYVYVANSTSLSISGFAVGSTGALSPVTGSPVSISSAPTAMVVNHANSILFVANSSAIYAYSISSNGALTALNSGSAVATAVISAMDVSPDGNMLYALDENSLLLRGFTINNSTGALSESTDGNLTSLPSTISAVSSQAVKVAPNGGSVFVALGSAGDMFFPVTNDTLGTGTPFGYISKLNSDNAITVDPTSAYIYIARSGNNGGLAVYSASNLSLNTNPYPAGNGPYSVVTNFAGSDVYVANRTDGNISGFSVTSSSTSVSLTSLSTSPYSSGSGVNGLAADKSGDYLLAINSGGSPGLSMYSYDSTTSGALDPAASATTGSGTITIAATH